MRSPAPRAASSSAARGVRYANCWEDARVLVGALVPRPGRRVLSIASGGDNALALAAAGAAVVAVDADAGQLAVLELKSSAIRRLDYGPLLAFLGVRESGDRLEAYGRLRPDLSPEARRFWDARAEAVARGIIHCGRFENFFRIFRRRVLPWIHSAETVARLLDEKDEEARLEFYEDRWNTWRWKALFRLFFSRAVIGRLGRGPEAFRHVRGPVGSRLLARTRRALTSLPIHSNPYLEYIVTGRFRRALPPYLEPDAFDKVRAGLARLSLVHGRVEDVAARRADGGFDGFNLSDVFEYEDAASFRAMGEALLNAAKPGARLAYWNMLVPRKLSGEFPGRLRALGRESERFFREDRAFFYGDFIVEEVQA